jgi:hypothetical protein
MERLKRRVSMLEQRNRELGQGMSKPRLDRLIWLLLEIESACPRPGVRGSIRVSHSDAKLLRPIVEALTPTPSAVLDLKEQK